MQNRKGNKESSAVVNYSVYLISVFILLIFVTASNHYFFIMKNFNYQIFTSMACAILMSFYLSTSFCQSTGIGVIGTATHIGGWSTDVDMNQDPNNSNLWTLNMTLSDGEVKFRMDDSWVVNWGGDRFPSGTAVPEGNNIPVTAGNYLVSFQTNTLLYNFSILGEGNTGIGTFSPQETLDVNGNVRFSGELKPDGVSGTDGQVLQSTGDGNMQWSDRASMQGSVGYGTWGDCEMQNITEYNPVCDPDGEAYDHFGYSVAISGDYAVVGSKDDSAAAGDNQGSVTFLHHNDTTGTWQVIQKVFNSSANEDDEFGYCVDISGEYAIVGAPRDFPLSLNYGSASIYKLNELLDQWEFQPPKLTNQYPQQDDKFGSSVSISGDYAIVGASEDDEGAGANQGSSCIFKRNSSTGIWEIQGGKLTDPDPGPGDGFGSSVAISGDYAIIGSPLDNGTDGNDEGSVNFFKRNEITGVWFPHGSKIYNSPPQAGENFGTSVDISGDVAIVGTPFDNDAFTDNHGAAMIFKRDIATDNWIQHGVKLYNKTIGADEKFGTSVSISGNIALVGTPYDVNNTNYAQGSAVIYMNIGPVWGLYQKIHDPGAYFNGFFGASCDIDGETGRFVVGAHNTYGGIGKVVFGKY